MLWTKKKYNNNNKQPWVSSENRMEDQSRESANFIKRLSFLKDFLFSKAEKLPILA